jgi:hypothetical protein
VDNSGDILTGWYNRRVAKSSPRTDRAKSTDSTPDSRGANGEAGDDGEIERETYLSERKLLTEGEFSVSQNFEKVLTALAGGALAISLVFINEVARKPPVCDVCLGGAYVGFGAALLLILISHLTAQEAYRRQRDILDDIYARKPGARQAVNKNERRTAILSYFSINLPR